MDRVLVKNGATVTDVTHFVSTYTDFSYEIDITDTTEIYIGKMLPFNHFYIHTETVKNVVSSNMSLEYWDGSQFRDVASLTDETSDSAASLALNGFVSWVPDKAYRWQEEDSENIAELSTVNYYDLYWNRVTFSSTLTADIVLKYIGQLFCTDAELFVEFPQFSEEDWLDGFEANKTEWTAQRITASNLIASKLRATDKIQTKDQIMDRLGLRDTCVQQTAAIIYNRFGEGRVEERKEAGFEAASRLKYAFPKIDKDNNARYNNKELSKTKHWTR